VTLKACLICGRAFQPTAPKQARCPEHSLPRLTRDRTYLKIRAVILANATVCGICGKPFTDPSDPAVLDHVRPRAYGGTDDPSNLQAAHRSCNGRKGAAISGWR